MSMNGMTIKQIAEVANVSESTVRNWIKTASAKTAGLSAKTADAQDGKEPIAITPPAPLDTSVRLAELADLARTGRKVPAAQLAEAVEIARHFQEERHALEVEILKCVEQIEILCSDIPVVPTAEVVERGR